MIDAVGLREFKLKDTFHADEANFGGTIGKVKKGVPFKTSEPTFLACVDAGQITCVEEVKTKQVDKKDAC